MTAGDLANSTSYQPLGLYIGSDTDEFEDDFKTQSGYSDLSSTTVLTAINDKILNSSTLTEENLIEHDPNIVDLHDDSSSSDEFQMFNPIQYLIENPDVLISANPLFSNSSNTKLFIL